MAGIVNRLAPSGDIKSGDIVYHGRRGNTKFTEGVPAFFTRNVHDAEWFFEHGDGEPVIIEAAVTFRKAIKALELRVIADSLDVTAEDAEAEGGYGAEHNNIDFIYSKVVQRYLDEHGIDAIVDWDVLENFEIQVVVVWHTRQIQKIKTLRNVAPS